MDSNVSVFGRPSTPSVAAGVMKSPSLTAVPSPAQPAGVPDDSLLKGYGRLLAACYELRKVETDPMRLVELEQIRHFADSTYSAIFESGPGGSPGSGTSDGLPVNPYAQQAEAPPAQAGSAPETPGAVGALAGAER